MVRDWNDGNCMGVIWRAVLEGRGKSEQWLRLAPRKIVMPLAGIPGRSWFEQGTKARA